MTTTKAPVPTIAQALDAYSATISAHGHDHDRGGCTCGWQPSRQGQHSPRSATARHLSAVARAADKAYDAAVAAAIAGGNA